MWWALDRELIWAIPNGPALYKEKPVPRSWVRRSWLGMKEGVGEIDYPDLS